MSDAVFKPENIQGNILRGYTFALVRYLVLEVRDRGAARQFLAAAVDGTSAEVPAITRESGKRKWDSPEAPGDNPRPTVCFNIGFTFEGLRALGTPAESLATFPTEFREGMAKRALKLGDFGDSAPSNWPVPFDKPARVHVIASIYSDDGGLLDRVEAQVARAFHVLGALNGRGYDKDKVVFGYRDNISQPRFDAVPDPIVDRLDEVHVRSEDEVPEPIDPLGTVLLGYPTRMSDLRFRVPDPVELGRDGTFNAFRVLEQDAGGFEAWLDTAAETLLDYPDVDQLLAPGYGDWARALLEWEFPGCDAFARIGARFGGGTGDRHDRFVALREVVAAQMCGRWRNGVPVELSPDTPLPDPAVSFTNFDYAPGSRCPAGSHLRRCNPRGGPIVQRIANYTRRLVRRGMPYGPPFNPLEPDDTPRGLLGNFIGASLGAQYEAVMCDWLNLGLQDPDITGSNDPLIGANTPETSWFDLVLRNGGTIRLRGFPRFVTTRGGAYAFLPGIEAIRYLSQLTG